jgi:hypothetical protein
VKPSLLSTVVVAILGLINFGRGAIHVFAPDGGLQMIAGLDISQTPPVALSLIASVGAGQIILGVVDWTAVLFHRSFVRPLIFIHAAQQAAAVLLLFVWRPFPHDVPGQWGALASLVIVGLFAALEISRKGDVEAEG